MTRTAILIGLLFAIGVILVTLLSPLFKGMGEALIFSIPFVVVLISLAVMMFDKNRTGDE